MRRYDPPFVVRVIYRILYLLLASGDSPRLQKRLGLASEPDIKSSGNRPTSLLDLSVLEQISAEGTTCLLVPSTYGHRKIV